MLLWTHRSTGGGTPTIPTEWMIISECHFCKYRKTVIHSSYCISISAIGAWIFVVPHRNAWCFLFLFNNPLLFKLVSPALLFFSSSWLIRPLLVAIWDSILWGVFKYSAYFLLLGWLTFSYGGIGVFIYSGYNSLLDVCTVDFFSHFVSYFTLLWKSFDEQSFLILI